MPHRSQAHAADDVRLYDGNGCLDAVAVNENSDNVSYFPGTGDAGCDLSQGRNVHTGQDVPKVIAAADFDGDGLFDLLVGPERIPDPDEFPPELVSPDLVYFPGGSGFPDQAQRITISSVDVRAIAVADFDGDGDLDAVVAHVDHVDDDSDQETPAVLEGILTFLEGTFSEGAFLLVPSKEQHDVPMVPTALTSDDFDADGVPDLAVIGPGDRNEN